MKSVNKELNIDSEIAQKTHWFCKLLVLWQCIYYVSDYAVSLLLKILSAIFKLLSMTSDVCCKVKRIFAENMYQLSKLLKSDMLDFKQYIVCTSCYSFYEFEDCFHIVEGLRVVKKCSDVQFPNHRLPHLRKRCNQPLLMEINSDSSKILVPVKIVRYKSIESSLNYFVKRNNFEDLCENWRTRETKEGVLYDIYDDRIWNEFNGTKYNFFFTKEGNYGCILNVDWFQPYKHAQYSLFVTFLEIKDFGRKICCW
jgi:sulfur relay (sulfurtransferase) DsrF/TusC family protein